MKRSHCALLSGCLGVIFLWVKPRYSANCLKACESKGGPLSDFRVFGLPVKLKILSRAGMTVYAFIEFRISTIGNREYSSISTIIYFPSGQGPEKSTLTSSITLSGILLIFNGSGM